MTQENEAARDLGQLREILLAPVEERNKERDEKILDFVEDMAKSLTGRIQELEDRIDELTNIIEQDRLQVVGDIGDAIAQLGQQLRHVGQPIGSYAKGDAEEDLKQTG